VNNIEEGYKYKKLNYCNLQTHTSQVTSFLSRIKPIKQITRTTTKDEAPEIP
jgi:hypothetical protein